jgi:hypothetical protein
MGMASAEELFGIAREYSDLEAWVEIEQISGDLPATYKSFVAAYGPGVFGNFLQVFHPDSTDFPMLDLIEELQPLYQEIVPEDIPCNIFPAESGAIQWASTPEGDACFLVPKSGGSWNIGVWFRQWAQWEEYDLDVPGWIISQIEGTLKIPGLPLRAVGGFTAVS